MKKNLTELVFILDKSSSMSGLEKDTVGGFNSMLKKQKESGGEVLVTTVLFNHETETVHDRLKAENVGALTEKEYYVGGCTALLDAVGKTVEHIKGIHKYIRDEDVPEHTLVVITTDGLENASRHYTASQVKQLIEAQKEAGWEFLFFGANIDAVATAAGFGIEKERAVDFNNDGEGINLNFEGVCKFIKTMSAGAPNGAEWKRDIEKDYKCRKKQK